MSEEVSGLTKRRMLAGVLVGVLAALPGCLPKDEGGCPYCPGGGAEVILEFEPVERGVHSAIRDARRVVVREAAAWASLWAEHIAGREPRPAVPVVDFAREMVIAFFWGEKPTSGYEATITEIALGRERIVVRVETVSPPPGAIVLQVLTQPHHIVKLPRSDLPVEFEALEVQGPI